MRRILFLALVIHLIVCGIVRPQAVNDELLRQIQISKRTIVAVSCMQKQQNQVPKAISIEGTAFFVSVDGTFVTAGHVAHGLYLDVPTRPCDFPVVYVPTEGWNVNGGSIHMRYIPIDTCQYDDDLDLAACGVKENPFKSLEIKVKPLAVTFDTSRRQDGEIAAFTGFPLASTVPITAVATIATYWGREGEADLREIILDHNNWPGASGSPVYLANGKVIGLILKRGMNDAVGLAFARSAVFIKGFLDKSSFRQEPKEGKK
jgi:V8-like Glu-specific endopeptidase